MTTTKNERWSAADPKPMLDEAAIYFGDNGRRFCGSLRCAGISAHYSARDLSGFRVEKAGAADNAEWLRMFKRPLTCETCGREFTA